MCVADASLQPYLDQINQIEEQVSSLEQAAYKLDTYSKKLGNTHTHGYGETGHIVILQVYIYTRAVRGEETTEFQCVTFTRLTEVVDRNKYLYFHSEFLEHLY